MAGGKPDRAVKRRTPAKEPNKEGSESPSDDDEAPRRGGSARQGEAKEGRKRKRGEAGEEASEGGDALPIIECPQSLQVLHCSCDRFPPRRVRCFTVKFVKLK